MVISTSHITSRHEREEKLKEKSNEKETEERIEAISKDNKELGTKNDSD